MSYGKRILKHISKYRVALLICLILLLFVLIPFVLASFHLHFQKSTQHPSEITKIEKDCRDAKAIVFFGGENTLEELSSVEVVVSPSHCTSPGKLPELPHVLSNPVAGFINDSLLVCGGCEDPYTPRCGEQTNCYVLDLRNKSEDWVKHYSLNEPRMYSASFQLSDGEMYVTGGASSDVTTNNGRSSVEVLTKYNGSWEKGSPLTSSTTHHCIATIGNFAFSTGGKSNGAEMSRFSLDDRIWEKVGEFLNDRYDHACIGFGKEGNHFILVEGGLTVIANDNEKCARTEIYNLAQNKLTGHHHFNCREGASLLEIDERILLVGGVVTTGDTPYYPTEILEFNQTLWLKDGTVKWTEVPDLELPIGRSGHAALVLPIQKLLYDKT